MFQNQNQDILVDVSGLTSSNSLQFHQRQLTNQIAIGVPYAA